MVSRRDVISFLQGERVEDLQRSMLFIFTNEIIFSDALFM